MTEACTSYKPGLLNIRKKRKISDTVYYYLVWFAILTFEQNDESTCRASERALTHY